MYKEGFLLNKIMTFEMLSFLPLVDAMSYYYFSDRGPNNNWFICLDVFINSLQNLKNNTLLYLSGKEHMCHASCWRERTTCRSPFHFYLLGPRNGTQIIRLASKHLYLLSNVFSPPRCLAWMNYENILFSDSCVAYEAHRVYFTLRFWQLFLY